MFRHIYRMKRESIPEEMDHIIKKETCLVLNIEF